MQQQNNQNQQGSKSSDQLRKPMESQANKPASEAQVPPTTEYNQEKHWAGKEQSSQAQDQAQPQPQAQPAGQFQAQANQKQAGIQQQYQQQQGAGRKPGQQAGEDRSKSFGESEVPAGGEVDHSDDEGVIPKENSFPNYSNPSGQAKDKQDYTH